MLKQIFCKIHESWQYLWVGTSYFRALCANFYWERGDYDILSTRVWVQNFAPKIIQDFLKIYGYWHWRVKNLLVGSEQWTIFSLIVQLSDLFQFTQFCRRRLDGLLLLGGTPSLKPCPFCFLNLVSPQSSLHNMQSTTLQWLQAFFICQERRWLDHSSW